MKDVQQKERRASQSSIPPIGVKRRDFFNKKASGHKPNYHGDGGFKTLYCGNRSCIRSATYFGSMSDKPIKCGAKRPTQCPDCGRVFSKRGFVDANGNASD